jgi:hypothetical protein
VFVVRCAGSYVTTSWPLVRGVLSGVCCRETSTMRRPRGDLRYCVTEDEIWFDIPIVSNIHCVFIFCVCSCIKELDIGTGSQICSKVTVQRKLSIADPPRGDIPYANNSVTSG